MSKQQEDNKEYFTESQSDLLKKILKERLGQDPFFGDMFDIHLEYINRRLKSLENEMKRIAERESREMKKSGGK